MNHDALYQLKAMLNPGGRNKPKERREREVKTKPVKRKK